MCDFCHKHGEGKKWYLDARNYSEDLLSDLKRRGFIEEFFTHPERIVEGDNQLGMFDKLPSFLKRSIAAKVQERAKESHIGQVVPIEDVERILDLGVSVARLACICRHALLGGEHRYCYGLSLGPNGGRLMEIVRGIDPAYLIGPTTGGLEFLARDQALAAMRENEREGMCHSVWTFMTPFLGGLCNCSLPGCMAMRATVSHRLPVIIRAEYVARLDAAACTACGACEPLCSYGALRPGDGGTMTVDPRACYGCGICRSVCPSGALSLVDRSSVPEASTLWL